MSACAGDYLILFEVYWLEGIDHFPSVLVKEDWNLAFDAAAMVELQSCASLVNASALSAIEQEVKAESVSSAVAQISAELQRERQKNAELSERICFLESHIRQILDKQSFPTHEIVPFPFFLTHS